MADKERLFFALWPDAERQGLWAGLARRLLQGAEGRFTRRETLHLTLLFLGEVDARQRAAIESAAAEIRLPNFSLNIDRLGYWRGPQVCWLGCSAENKTLAELAGQLRAAAEIAGVRVEKRPFRPHITVMRKVRRPPPAAVPGLPVWPVERFVLVRSKPHGGAAEYQTVAEWFLVD